MEFVKGAEIQTDDFYYDLFDGGYIKPEKLLKNKEDIDRLKEAIKIVKKFHDEAEEQGVLEYL